MLGDVFRLRNRVSMLARENDICDRFALAYFSKPYRLLGRINQGYCRFRCGQYLGLEFPIM